MIVHYGSKDRPLSSLPVLFGSNDRPVWLKNVHFWMDRQLSRDRPLEGPSTVTPLTVHFGPDFKCSLPFISIFRTKMLRSSFEIRSLLIQSFLSNIEIPVRVSHKSLTDLKATLMTDLEYFFNISWFLMSQTTFQSSLTKHRTNPGFWTGWLFDKILFYKRSLCRTVKLLN